MLLFFHAHRIYDGLEEVRHRIDVFYPTGSDHRVSSYKRTRPHDSYLHNVFVRDAPLALDNVTVSLRVHGTRRILQSHIVTERASHLHFLSLTLHRHGNYEECGINFFSRVLS